MKKTPLLTAVAATVLMLVACKDKPDFEYYYYSDEEYALIQESLNLPEKPYEYNLDLSARGILNGNKVSSDQATLGRVLFYDKKLSKDQTISCASCHKQELAFGDDHAVSTGVFERQGERNSIALASVPSFRAAGYGVDVFTGGGKHFFWDNRAPTAADQSRLSMSNPKEMDMSMPEIVAAVQSQPFYVPLFKKAFGDDRVNEERITSAIAEFVNSLVSVSTEFDNAVLHEHNNNRFDQVNTNFEKFTASQNRGKTLYMANCATCHGFDMITTTVDATNNGLDVESLDPGVGGITQNPFQMGVFKVPALRNIALTYPYMHDGRFQTLEQVIDHYSNGVKNHPNLDAKLKGNNPDGAPVAMNFTSEQKADLIAFLNTLTDTELAAQVRFSDPFKR